MVGSVYYSLVNAVAVITGVVYGYFIFGQQFSWLTIIAVMVILFAILVLTYTQKNRADIAILLNKQSRKYSER